jgi:hypothetical protein
MRSMEADQSRHQPPGTRAAWHRLEMVPQNYCLSATARCVCRCYASPAPGPAGAAAAPWAGEPRPQSGGALPGADEVVGGAVDHCPNRGGGADQQCRGACPRPVVLWRKGSFGSDREDGSRFAERLLRMVATCRQQGRSLLDFLVATGEAVPRGIAAPSLLPAHQGAECWRLKERRECRWTSS